MDDLTPALTPKPLERISMPHRYDLYVDGSPGPKNAAGWSGWGVVLMCGDAVMFEACGYMAERGTSNAAELEALIQGLAYLQRLHFPTVIPMWTDSKYVAETVANLPRIAARSFNDEKGAPIKNRDRIKLIFELLYDLELINATVIRWVKGHAKTTGNELADKLSKAAAYQGQAYYKELPKHEQS